MRILFGLILVEIVGGVVGGGYYLNVLSLAWLLHIGHR